MVVVFGLYFLCMESNASVKSMNNRVASRFFACTPLMMRQIVRIYDIMIRFLLKPDFSLEFFFARIRLRSRALKNLATVEVRVMPLLFLVIPMSFFLDKKKNAAFYSFLCCILYKLSVTWLKKYVINVPCLHYFRRNFVKVSRLSAFNFFNPVLSFSSVICPILMSSRLSIIFSVVISGRFPSRFLKWFFSFLKSFFMASSFCFVLEVIFLLLNSFDVGRAKQDYLSSTEFWSYWFGLESILLVLFGVC